MKKTTPKPVVLISLDGWGINPIPKGNAIAQGATKNIDNLMRNYPFTIVEASGIAVGLPWGEVGNSEVGHLNLGAGKVVYQSLPRIQIAIQNGEFEKNQNLLDVIEHVKKNKSKLHLIGLASNGGVHGHIDHAIELLRVCKKNKLKKQVFVHCITDGRDTPPTVADRFIADLQKAMKKIRCGSIVSMVGRYYAMDRNHNWDRTKLAYELLTKGAALHFRDPIKAIKELYEKGMNDEALEPTMITDRKGNPLALIEEGDGVIFWNYRPDRARQLTQAFVSDEFDGFEREKIRDLKFATMMQYEAGLPVDLLFEPDYIKEPVGKIVSDAGMKQLRIAETEKYAHVTYFFNGGSEEELKNEDRALIPSPDVKTYDLKPEMSAVEIADRVIKEIESGKYDFIMMNFANADMVGHTGKFDAAKIGVQTVDESVQRVVEAVLAAGGAAVISADHGNAELMKDPIKGSILKEHTTAPVFVIVIEQGRERELDEETFQIMSGQLNPVGILADVGPTVLELLNLNASKEMTGRSLLNDLV